MVCFMALNLRKNGQIIKHFVGFLGNRMSFIRLYSIATSLNLSQSIRCGAGSLIFVSLTRREVDIPSLKQVRLWQMC